MIKKILFIFSLLFIGSTVYAEKFVLGDYISGEYIKMVNDKTYKYLTIQKIVDSNGKFVYCIEPFILIDENTEEYTTYVKNLNGYKDLSAEQKRSISLIAYYGYGYEDRITPKWYAITQMLIWRTVDPDSEFYFTDKVNGNKISKYADLINQILNDVYNHDIDPDFVKDYNVNYHDDLIITNYDDSYTVETAYDYVYDSSKATLNVSDVDSGGTFIFEKDADRYLSDIVIYDSKDSQDLIRPGKLLNKKHVINVNVTSGNINLDIRKDTSDIYTTQSDFNNTCYEISNSETVVDKVCTSNDNLVYKTDKLPFGEYYIKQVSVGTGYEVDTNTYTVTVDGNDNTVLLNNSLIKNKIELVKYYCKDDNCLYEENAIFKVYDKDNSLVGSISTDDNGYGYIEVGYGKYTIIQEDGLDNYTFVNNYSEDIVNSSDTHYNELYNYYIIENEEENDPVEPGDTSDKGQDNEEPDNTSEEGQDPIEPGNTSDEEQNTEEPDDTPEENQDNVEPGNTSEEEQDNVEPSDTSEEKQDNVEPSDTSEENQDTEELGDATEEKQDTDKPDDTPEENQDTEEPGNTSDEEQNTEIPSDTSDKEQDNVEPGDISKEEQDNVEPSDTSEENNNQEIIEPPHTGTKLAQLTKILYNVIMVVICYCIFKRFCYNN